MENGLSQRSRVNWLLFEMTGIMARLRARFWILLAILVMVFVSASIRILNRIASPSVTTRAGVSRPPPNWRGFVSTELGFSVLFPRKPKKSTESITNRAGLMLVRQHYSELDQAHAYGISVADLPFTNTFSEEQIQIMLNAGRDEALGTDGKLVAERKITLDSNLGREFDMEKLGGQAFVKVRVYFIKNRIYTLTAVGPYRERVSTNAFRFLDSFKLIESSTNN